MFKGSNSLSFKTDKPREKVMEIIADCLESVGPVDISDKGMVKINATKYGGFGHESTIEGTVRDKEGKFTLQLDFQSKLNTVGWIIFICTIGGLIGILMFIFPVLAKNEMNAKIDSAINNIRMEFK